MEPRAVRRGPGHRRRSRLRGVRRGMSMDYRYDAGRRRLLALLGSGAVATIGGAASTHGETRLPGEPASSTSQVAADDPLSTRLTREYGVRFPFVSAGMGFVSYPPLVTAVSNAGDAGVQRRGADAGHDRELRGDGIPRRRRQRSEDQIDQTGSRHRGDNDGGSARHSHWSALSSRKAEQPPRKGVLVTDALGKMSVAECQRHIFWSRERTDVVRNTGRRARY
jgi:hypothetical protein